MNLPDAPIAHVSSSRISYREGSGKSKDFYVRILGGKVIKPENPCCIKLATPWIVLNSGGGPTPDKRGPPESWMPYVFTSIEDLGTSAINGARAGRRLTTKNKIDPNRRVMQSNGLKRKTSPTF